MKLLVIDLCGRSYALPAASVRQVNEASAVTPLPFVPSYVEGLTAVGGSVLPQVDLAVRLGVAAKGGGDELIVVTTLSGECVLRIDHAHRILDIDDEDVSPFDQSGEAIAGEFDLEGQPVMLLRPEALGIDGVEVAENAPGGALALFGEASAGAVVAAGSTDLVACLEVGLGTEGYAFPLERVSEVYVDTQLAPLPNVPDFIMGLSVRRGIPRLVLSLSKLMGLGGDHPGERVVMVSVGDMTLGFQCDRFVGIRRYGPDRRESATDSSGALSSYLMGANGEVVGLLDLDGLVDARVMGLLRPHYPHSKESGAVTRTVQTKRFLLMKAGRETCGIEVERVVRVAGYTQPTPVPGASDILLGMIEIGGDVLPVADVVRAVGGHDNPHAGAFVVVRTESGVWTLRVTDLERLVDIPVDAIRASTAGVGRIISGVARFGDRLVSLLDVAALDAIPVGGDDPEPDLSAPIDDGHLLSGGEGVAA